MIDNKIEKKRWGVCAYLRAGCNKFDTSYFMIPIVINNNQPFDDHGFKDYLLNICKTHKDQQRALAFAFIVYDFADYTITQILQDKNYWTTLDKLSGHYLSVFYVNSQNEYYNSRQQEIYLEEKYRQEEIARKGYISYFVPVTLKATPLDKTISLIKNDFKIEDDIKHPLIIFFQSNGEEILDYFLVSLKQEKLEDAFLELKSLLKDAVEGIKQVTPENFENHQEIFDLLKGQIKRGQFYKFISKKIVPKLTIGTILSIVKTIAGH